MSNKANKIIILLLSLVIVGFTFLLLKENTNQKNLKYNQTVEIIHVLLRENLFKQAMEQAEVISLQFSDEQKNRKLSNYIKDSAKKHIHEICTYLEKNWENLSEKQKDEQFFLLNQHKKNQLSENRITIDNFIKEFSEKQKKEQQKLSNTKKAKIRFEVHNSLESALNKNPKKEKLQSIEEQLKKSWENLLAKESPDKKSQLKKIEKILASTRSTYYYTRSLSDLYQTRSKALIPLLLKTMYNMRNHNSTSMNQLSKVITILTGKPIQFMRRRAKNELENLIKEWWLPQQDTIKIEYKLLSREQKDHVIKSIISVSSGGRGYSSTYKVKIKDPKYLKNIFYIFTKPRNRTKVKCTSEMISGLWEYAETEMCWYLVNIFAELHKSGEYPNLSSIPSDKKYSNAAQFIAVLSLWKIGEKVDALQVFSFAEKESNQTKKLMMLMMLKHCDNVSRILPKLLSKFDEEDKILKKTICYALEKFIPSKEQRFIFTPYLSEIEQLFSYQLNDQYALNILSNIASKPAIEILVRYLEKIYENQSQSYLINAVLASIKKTSQVDWVVDRYYEKNYQIAREVIRNWRGEEIPQKSEEEIRFKKAEWLAKSKKGKILQVGSKPKEPKEGVNYYERLSVAITEASTGDTIFLSPGIYNESIHIPAGVTLDGIAPDKVKVQGFISLRSESKLQNITIEMSNIAIKIIDVRGALVRNCWIKHIGALTHAENIKAVDIRDSLQVVFLQNVIYDVIGKKINDVKAISSVNSTGVIMNNIIGRVTSPKNSVYAIFLNRSPKMSIVNNTISFVKSDKKRAYGIYVEKDTNAVMKNNIINNIKGTESYGIVNQSNFCKVTYNGGFDAKSLYIGGTNNNYADNPNFINGANGDLQLEPNSMYLTMGNIDTKIDLGDIKAQEFSTEIGAFGGYFPLNKDHVTHLKKFSPKTIKSNIRNRFGNQSIWHSNNYIYRSIRRNISDLRTPRKKLRAKMELKRYAKQSLEALEEIANNKAPAQYRDLILEAQALIREIKREKQIGTWSFGK